MDNLWFNSLSTDKRKWMINVLIIIKQNTHIYIILVNHFFYSSILVSGFGLAGFYSSILLSAGFSSFLGSAFGYYFLGTGWFIIVFIFSTSWLFFYLSWDPEYLGFYQFLLSLLTFSTSWVHFFVYSSFWNPGSLIFGSTCLYF